MRCFLFATIGFLFWPGLWRVELTDSAAVRINRLTGVIEVTPLPNSAEVENDERRANGDDDEKECQCSCADGARDDEHDDQYKNLRMAGPPRTSTEGNDKRESESPSPTMVLSGL
jgi:hypothetical protein